VDAGGWYGVHRQEGNIIADKNFEERGMFFGDLERVGGITEFGAGLDNCGEGEGGRGRVGGEE